MLELAQQAIAVMGVNSEADKWLTEFEKKPIAWEIAHQLLGTDVTQQQVGASSQFRFWGAKILYTKAKKDFGQLDENSAEQLANQLVHRILQLASELTLDMVVCRYVCLALAALSIKLKSDGNVVAQILTWLNSIVQTKPLIILELLIVLAEECHDVYGMSTDNQFSQQLTASVEKVFSFLNELVTAPTIDKGTYNQVLKCVRIWVETTNIPAEYLLHHPIFQHAVQGLGRLDLIEESCELFIVSLRKYCTCEDFYDMFEEVDEEEEERRIQEMELSENVMFKLIPPVINMIKTWKAHRVDQDSDDEDLNKNRAMVRLFAETCELSARVMVDGTFKEKLSAEDEMILVNQMLECASVSYDNDIARIPLDFFYQLSARVIENGDPTMFEEDVNKYSSCYSNLLQIINMQLQNLEQKTDESERERDQQEWCDTAMDCSQLLQADFCVSEVCKLLQQNSSNVSVLKASIMMLKSLCKKISVRETGMTPWIIQNLTTMWPMNELKIPIIQFIGSISNWVAHNNNYTGNLLFVLREALSTEEYCVHASEAIRDMCKAVCCYSDPSCIPILELHGQILQMRSVSNSKNCKQADLNILEAIAIAISTFKTATEVEGALQFALNPICESLVTNINTLTAASATPSPEIMESFVADIDRLAHIYRHTTVEDLDYSLSGNNNVHPLLKIFSQLFPILEKLVIVAPSFSTHDKICRFYKYMIRTLKDLFIPSLEHMCRHLVNAFDKHSTSPFIYIAAICIAEYGEKNELHTMFMELQDAITRALFSKYASLDQLDQSPDVIEEFFFFYSRILKSCPGIFIQVDTTRMVQVIQAGLTAIKIPHKDVQNGILDFFEHLVKVADPTARARVYSAKPSKVDPAMIKIVTDILPHFAPALLSNLIENVAGRIPEIALRLGIDKGTISSVMFTIKQSVSFDQFQQWIDASFASLNNDVQLEAARLGIHQGTLQDSDGLRGFSNLIDKLQANIKRQCSNSA